MRMFGAEPMHSGPDSSSLTERCSWRRKIESHEWFSVQLCHGRHASRQSAAPNLITDSPT
jgi:hypothetical protein